VSRAVAALLSIAARRLSELGGALRELLLEEAAEQR
jgi:hypothetical protein